VDRRNLPQFVEDLGSPDVARMNDVSDSRERTDRFRTKQSVSIGNEADRFQRPYSPVPKSVRPCTTAISSPPVGASRS
jgi:hypothetical protein